MDYLTGCSLYNYLLAISIFHKYTLVSIVCTLCYRQLSNNQFVNLRSDLLPIFSSIRTLLELQGNRNFSCDCHLHWLVDFVNNANLASTVTADMLCQQPLQAAGLAIIDPTVDFNLAACGGTAILSLLLLLLLLQCN